MELKHAILGLLSFEPMSGYDLGRAFANVVDHFWHADQSQIYRTLNRLAQAGAITTTVVPQDGKPDRKVHSLTEIGRDELTAWLQSPLDADEPKEPFLARIFFAGPLGAEKVLALLEERKRRVEQFVNELTALPTATTDLAATLRVATLRNGLAHAQAELTWIQQTKNTLSQLED